jgi:hypothetical protein
MTLKSMDNETKRRSEEQNKELEEEVARQAAANGNDVKIANTANANSNIPGNANANAANAVVANTNNTGGNAGNAGSNTGSNTSSNTDTGNTNSANSANTKGPPAMPKAPPIPRAPGDYSDREPKERARLEKAWKTQSEFNEIMTKNSRLGKPRVGVGDKS